MLQQILLAIIGLSGGFIVAGGMVALIIGLGIIPRFAAITHTGSHVLLYENCVLAGAFIGSLITVFKFSLPFGAVGLAVYGLFAGIFLGSWVLALAETVNAFPIFSRRIGLTKGMPLLIISIAAGKLVGGLLFFINRM